MQKKGKNIYEVLEMTIEEAYEFFFDIPAIADRLKSLLDVGLGYIKWGNQQIHCLEENHNV